MNRGEAKSTAAAILLVTIIIPTLVTGDIHHVFFFRVLVSAILLWAIKTAMLIWGYNHLQPDFLEVITMMLQGLCGL